MGSGRLLVNTTRFSVPATDSQSLKLAQRQFIIFMTFRPCHVALTGTALVEVVGASCLQVGSDILPGAFMAWHRVTLLRVSVV